MGEQEVWSTDKMSSGCRTRLLALMGRKVALFSRRKVSADQASFQVVSGCAILDNLWGREKVVW